MTQSSPRPQQTWIGQTIANRYKIESMLGQGGMSTVYMAQDANLRRKVAIKLIHPHLSNDPQFVRRFEQEAAAVAQLRHPNIIQVYDFADDAGVFYMVMEYVPGETLQARLTTLNAAKQFLPLAEIIQTTASICDAVAYAHQRGMIHRDLKPANVMLNPQGQPILMDFGVAKMLGESQHTATGAVIGTALYMSPEQARGEKPDERSDIYSIGVMLFEMITGAPPFKADSAISLMMKHVTQPIPDIRQLNQYAPDLLIAVTRKALAKETGERYRTASDMALALRATDVSGRGVTSSIHRTHVGLDTPALGTPPLPSEVVAPASVTPARKFNPLFLILGGLALLALLGIGLGSVWLFNRPKPTAVTLNAAELPGAQGMIKIGAGDYFVGREASGANYTPPQQVKLAEFWLDAHEVSSAQYDEYLKASQSQPPAGWPKSLAEDQANLPAQGLTWDMANAYCQWANKRLPSEAEWEVAARGSEGRLFPWGNDPKAIKLPQSGTYPVGAKPTNQSPFGIFDMAGNVWEWVDESYAPVAEGNKVLRGGENGLLKDMAYRLIGPPDQESMIRTAGVRCAADKVQPLADAVKVEGVLAQEDFANPGSGWPILSEGSYFYGYHPPDYYHVEVGQAESHTIVSREAKYDNVLVEAEVLVDHTTTASGTFRYGLALRRTADDYYAFTVSSRSGEWAVLKSSAAGINVLKEGKVNNLQGIAPAGFTPDKSDTLQVTASGSNFNFQINGQSVADLNDADYGSGEIGFFVQTFDETLAHIHFDALTISQAEAGAQGSNAPEQPNQLEDSFTDSTSGWPVSKDDKYIIGYHPPDYYHVQVGVPNDRTVVTYPQEFTDVTVETEVLVDHTDTEAGNFRYGLALRRTGDEFYAFVVSPRSGTWQALISSVDGLKVMAEGEINTLRGFAPAGFTPDKTDTLRVDAKGGDFIFHINGQPVTQISNADYAKGAVGFFVETFDETLAHVHYEQIKIREVEFEPVALAPTESPPETTAPTGVVEVAAVPPSATPSPAPATPTVPPTLAPPSPTLTPTLTPPSPTPTKADPTATPEPPTATPNPVPQDMVLVPAGYFKMGSTNGQANEQPEHPVFVDAFYLDTYEVTNAQYRECVGEGNCTASNKADSFTYPGYRSDPAYDDYPVVGVTWDQAAGYCNWAFRRLPTEAEWEYAASGPQNLTWPWGNTFDPKLSAASAPDTQPVDSYPAGVSPFGVYNMAGNVAEWVADVFDETFYANSPAVNPVAKGSSGGRIFRGGSFGNPDGAFFTTSRRYGNANSFNDVDVGFRCAQDAADATPTEERQALLTEFCAVFTAYKPGVTCP
jgi:serine/threonine-protein kinase